jgi:hypothetical protein
MSDAIRRRLLPLAVLLTGLAAAAGAALEAGAVAPGPSGRQSLVAAVPARSLALQLRAAIGAAATQTPRLLTASMPAQVGNREMQPLVEAPRRGLRLDARMGDGVAWWPDAQLGNGTIELDLRGRNLPQQSFVGVAFHGVDETTFDAVYFRPFNFRAATDVGRARSVQYVSHPTYTWDRLRAEHPGQYEGAITPPPDPDDWFHARLEITHPTVRVFVDPVAAPVLEVRQLNDRRSGWVGVWVGNGSAGAFANVAIASSRP